MSHITDGVWRCIIECISVKYNLCSWSLNIFWILYRIYFLYIWKTIKFVKWILFMERVMTHTLDMNVWDSLPDLRARNFGSDRKYPNFIRLLFLLLPILIVLADFWSIFLMSHNYDSKLYIQACIFDPIKIFRCERKIRRVRKRGQTRSTFWSFDS